jgi:hypothetical protein
MTSTLRRFKVFSSRNGRPSSWREENMENVLRDYLGTPDHLIALAQEGRLAKQVLVRFLATDKRQAYLDACAVIEKRYTDDCADSGSPCLEGGCAVEGDVCPQPLLRADIDYFRACGQE